MNIERVCQYEGGVSIETVLRGMVCVLVCLELRERK